MGKGRKRKDKEKRKARRELSLTGKEGTTLQKQKDRFEDWEIEMKREGRGSRE